jgi:putative endonuclease
MPFGDRPMARPQRFASELARVAMQAGKTATMYYTYVLKSLKDLKLYVGYTDDLTIRYEQHQKGLVKSTKNRRPFKLVYYEACLDKEKAIKREKQLKTGFGRKYLKNRL